MAMQLHQIEQALKRIIPSFDSQLPPHQLDQMAELVDAGEPGIAFENLCTQLFEYDIKINSDMLVIFEEIGGAMGTKEKYWQRLSVRND
jgi:hypothetical protein